MQNDNVIGDQAPDPIMDEVRLWADMAAHDEGVSRGIRFRMSEIAGEIAAVLAPTPPEPARCGLHVGFHPCEFCARFGIVTDPAV